MDNPNEQERRDVQTFLQLAWGDQGAFIASLPEGHWLTRPLPPMKDGKPYEVKFICGYERFDPKGLN